MNPHIIARWNDGFRDFFHIKCDVVSFVVTLEVKIKVLKKFKNLRKNLTGGIGQSPDKSEPFAISGKTYSKER